MALTAACITDSMAPNKRISGNYFSYFCMKIYVVGTHMKHLSITFVMDTH